MIRWFEQMWKCVPCLLIWSTNQFDSCLTCGRDSKCDLKITSVTWHFFSETSISYQRRICVVLAWSGSGIHKYLKYMLKNSNVYLVLVWKNQSLVSVRLPKQNTRQTKEYKLAVCILWWLWLEAVSCFWFCWLFLCSNPALVQVIFFF